MSATKVLDLAEQQALLEPKVIADLRRQVSESKFIVTPEALAKVLVDNGHLTAFQARKLVDTALGTGDAERPAPPAPMQIAPPKPKRVEDLTLADEDGLGLADSVDEDIVMLEPVAPPPKAARPASKPNPDSVPKAPQTEAPPVSPKSDKRAERSEKPSPPKPSRPAAVPPGPTVEIVDLEAVDDAPPATPPAKGPWRGNVPPPERPVPDRPPVSAGFEPVAYSGAASAVGLESLDPSAPGAASSGMADPFADPMLAGADALAPSNPLAKPQLAARRRNVWDSPLLLIGGGVLGAIVVAFALLWYSLTRGSAAEVLSKADEDYRGGSYSNAMVGYEGFLASYPSDPNVSYAKVKLGMAKLRQASADGKNPKQGLQMAGVVLPAIATEEKFSEARPELSTLLPDIADGFATLAIDAQERAQKEELVAQAQEAMELVLNPSYIPASLRKERESRIAAIDDKLKLAQRSIEEDKELRRALAQIAERTEAHKAAEAYQVRTDLLKVYPALEANADLQAATQAVTEQERQLVEVREETRAATTDDPQAPGSRLVLSARSGPEPDAPAKFAYVPVAGAVYGLDAASGRALWRRHVGYETVIPPQAISRDDAADALLTDSREHYLLRAAAATGQLVWRQALAEPYYTPTIAGERLLVTTASGRVCQIDATSGELVRFAQLPQGATVPAAVDEASGRLIQLGEHSTLFVLSGESLACTETYYLGHRAGSILVPPAVVLDHLLVPESPADDHTLVHVLAPAGEQKRLQEIGQPFRLKGRVVVPPVVVGRRTILVTDQGQVAVYEVVPSNRAQPVRPLAGIAATGGTPSFNFYTADANRLWLAGRGCSMYEIQAAVQSLKSGWTRHQESTFIAPLVLRGDTLVHVRQSPDHPGVIVEGCQAATGDKIWTTELAVPLLGLTASVPRRTVDAITEQGRVFPISSEKLKTGIVDRPAFPLPAEWRGRARPELLVSPDGRRITWVESGPGGRIVAYPAGDGTAPQAIVRTDSKEAAVAAPIAAWGTNLVVPLDSGTVELVGPGGERAALPLFPATTPELLPKWTNAVVLPDDAGLVIGDGRRKVFRVELKDRPDKHLAAAAERNFELEVTGPLALAGKTLFALARREAGQVVLALDPQTLEIRGERPLAGQALFGPVASPHGVFAATLTDGLLCLDDGNELRWQIPFAHGAPAGPPLATPQGALLLLSQNGTISLLAAADGKELAASDVGEPLGAAACFVGKEIFAATSDGAVVRVPIPQ
jgi:outer membrane protein assembly factor BamB